MSEQRVDPPLGLGSGEGRMRSLAGAEGWVLLGVGAISLAKAGD